MANTGSRILKAPRLATGHWPLAVAASVGAAAQQRADVQNQGYAAVAQEVGARDTVNPLLT